MGCQQCWQVWRCEGDSFEQFWRRQYLGLSNDGNRRPANTNTDCHTNPHRDANSDPYVVRSRNAFHHGSGNDERQESWSANYCEHGHVGTGFGLPKLWSDV